MTTLTPATSSPFEQNSLVGSNRRRSTRELAMTRGLLRSASAGTRGTSQEAMVTNISLHGVGLISTLELLEGEFFYIEIGVGPLHLTSRMRVVRCEARPDGYFDAGCEFC
jgi:hypothetical protein